MTAAEVFADVEARMRSVMPKSRVLLLGPDGTRASSFAGEISERIYRCLKQKRCIVHLMPTVGTHCPSFQDLAVMKGMYGEIPFEDYRWHHYNQKGELETIGDISAAEMKIISNGQIREPLRIEVNRLLFQGGYDKVFSIGQVVPHEVLGMANYDKNVFVGLGGTAFIAGTHYLSALCGIENVLGDVDAKPRRLLDIASAVYRQRSDAPEIEYILTVRGVAPDQSIGTYGVFFGGDKSVFREAAKLSRMLNIFRLQYRPNAFVVRLPQKKFRSLWLCAKGIYRTRKAVAEGGEIHLLAPGLNRVGEGEIQTRYINQIGYAGTSKIRDLVEQDSAKAGIGEHLGVAAHLIHGSTENKFRVTYYVKDPEIFHKVAESDRSNGSPGYRFRPLQEGLAKFGQLPVSDGNGDVEQHPFLIDDPGLGLWTSC